MAAVLKKRALAEYCQTIQEETPRPAKRLILVRRSKGSENLPFQLSGLDRNLDPEVLLSNLIKLQKSAPIPAELRGDVVRRLTDLLQLCEKENLVCEDSSTHYFNMDVVISKALALLQHITPPQDTQFVVERIITCGTLSKSETVIAHAIVTSSAIITNNSASSRLFDQVLQFVIGHLDSTHFLIKVKCLEATGKLCPVENGTQQTTLVESLVSHTLHQDNRVRTASFIALLNLLKRDILLPAELYDKVSLAVKDDYQCAREAALCLIKALSEKDPERLVLSEGDEHHLRLLDHAFTQICNSVNDGSVRVRTLAVSLLGNVVGVSSHFLLQTLDKKLMSNMRRKTSAHERAKVMASSGDWSTGRRWAEDRPQEFIAAQEAQVISSGSCGAFVHGLEDEFLEVRSASLDSICQLAEDNPQFANQCLDFLVDMFNDEIEEVRLKAIHVLQKIAHHTKLRPDQLDEILHALKDTSLDIRECLYTLMGTCKLTTMSCVTLCANALFNNLRRNPQDKRSIHRCFKQIGTHHPQLVLALVPQLLVIHPYFDGVEPSVQDGEYICKLILILNAAAQCPTILPLLEEHTRRHYIYLRDTIPHLVPQLKQFNTETIFSEEIVQTNTANFFRESLERLARSEQCSPQLRLTVYATIHSDFLKLADIDLSLSAAANFAGQYIQCMQLFTKVLSNRNWMTPSALSSRQNGALKTNVDQLLRTTLKLRYDFSNMSSTEEAAVRSLRVKTLALQLVYVVHGSTGSALGLCDNFLEHMEALHKYLTQQQLRADTFTSAVVQQLSMLEEPRPGAVARILGPLLLTHNVPALRPFANPGAMHMCWADIREPSPDSEVVHKLNSGLVVGIHLDVELWHVPDLSTLRIRVTYPDHTSQYTTPSPDDIRPGEGGSHRLLSNVLISAQVWSEACQVALSIVLDSSEQEALAGKKQSMARADEAFTTVQLCQPVKVTVWPKPIRKGV